MKKSKNNNETANVDTSNECEDSSRFSSKQTDKEYCEFCDEVFTWSAGAYHYKCWIR